MLISSRERSTEVKAAPVYYMGLESNFSPPNDYTITAGCVNPICTLLEAGREALLDQPAVPCSRRPSGVKSTGVL